MMLEVHAPHETVHTWKDFFIHIATIVVGLLIAVGLEQTMEAVHHRHQLHIAQENLRDEALSNREIIRADLMHVDAARRAIRENMDVLGSTSSTPSIVPYIGETYLFMISDAAWLTLRDNNLLSLLPPEVSYRYWKLDYTHSVVVDDNRNIIQRREASEALLHLHKDPSLLTTTQREQLLLAFGELDQALAQIHGSLTIYNAVNDAALAGETLSESTFKSLTR
jgi:hypothetical protein